MSFIQRPQLPGTVIKFTGTQAPRILPSAADVVAIPLVHDWGPVGANPPGVDGRQGGAQLVTSFAEFTGLFGDSDTAGRTAVAGAFAGQGLPGAPGAGGVLVYRMVGASGRAATISINKAGGGPAMLSLTARFPGSRGNRFTYTVDADPSNAANDRLRLYLDGLLQEEYVYSTPSLAAFVALINAQSNMVTAAALVADAAAGRLTATANPVALATGDDGATVLSTDHLAALAAIAYKPFGVLAPYDLTDAAIQASYRSWVQGQAAASRPCRLVLGGATGDTVAAAITRSAALSDEHVMNFGAGVYHDDLLGKDLTSSQLAPRIAGILAAKGEEHSITFAKIGGLHVVSGPSDDEVLLALNGGVVILTPTSSPDADLRIEKGVTTYTGDTPSKPRDVFGDARLVGIMDNYVSNMKQWGDDTVIGALPVNEDTRSLVRGHARHLEDDLQRRGLLLPGNPKANPPIPAPWVVCEDPGDPALADTIPYTFGWQFAKTTNAIVGQGAVL